MLTHIIVIALILAVPVVYGLRCKRVMERKAERYPRQDDEFKEICWKEGKRWVVKATANYDEWYAMN